MDCGINVDRIGYVFFFSACTHVIVRIRAYSMNAVKQSSCVIQSISFFSLYSDWRSQQEYMGEKIDVISLCWLYEYIIFSVIPVILCAEAICGVNGWEHEWFLPLQRILAQLPLWWSGFVWTINVKGGICHRNSWLNTLARSQQGKHMSNCIITSNISMNRNPLFQRFLLTTFLFKKQYWKFQLKTTTTNM